MLMVKLADFYITHLLSLVHYSKINVIFRMCTTSATQASVIFAMYSGNSHRNYM